MSAIAIFSFENNQVRTLGTAEAPLFIAVDVASALGFKDKTNAIKQHVDLEDLTKQEITDSMGRKQTVNCVNESGLYALIFGSKLESAKRFKRWVTSEVLPAIRKQGRYECPTQTITPEEQLAIQLAVSHRAKKTSSHYQTIYRAIKVRYQIAKYDQLPRSQFEDGLRFVESVDLNVLIARSEHTLPEERFLSDSELIALKNLHRFHCDPFWKNCALAAYKVLAAADSTFAGRFYDLIHEPIFSLLRVEEILNRNGIRIAY